MIYSTPPDDFKKRFDIVSCFIESRGNVLLLKRHEDKPQGGTWCLPAGKVDEGENFLKAIQREIQEEIGLTIPQNKIALITTVYCRHHGYDFPYHMFKTQIESEPKVILNEKEHTRFKWLTIEEAFTYDLIDDEDECIKIAYNL